MRRPSVFVDRREQLDVTMTPMIDVVFLLLVFFVWTASFRIVESLLPSSLSAVSGSQPVNPNDPPPPEADFDDVVVRVSWVEGRPAWKVNSADVGSLAELRRRMESIAAVKRDAPVILHPDPEVPLGDVIDVYDISRLVGFEKVQFAASERI